MVVMALMLTIGMTACGSTTETDAMQDVKDTLEIASAASDETIGSEETDKKSTDVESSSPEQQSGMVQDGAGALVPDRQEKAQQ